jgi:hypothetical protein
MKPLTTHTAAENYLDLSEKERKIIKREAKKSQEEGKEIN